MRFGFGVRLCCWLLLRVIQKPEDALMVFSYHKPPSLETGLKPWYPACAHEHGLWAGQVGKL